MRFISILCIVLVMALNMVPCADAHEPVVPSFSSSVDTAAPEHSEQSDDACTPFCHCSCCASSVVLKIAANLVAPFSVHQVSSLPPLEARSIDVSLSVWQPPKLG